ncbi:MAG: hypothetical protein QXT45_06225 [Candidatus Bilamarchaeaceae archaeon]
MPAVPIDPMRAQQYRTQRAELPEDLWQPLYDRANYPAAGTTLVSFFATPRGQSATLFSTFATPGTWTAAAKGKTFRDTNMENANVVPTKLFKAVGVSWGVLHSSVNSALNAVDREVLRGGGYLQFRIVDKDILFLPLIMIPELNPFSAVSTTATSTTINGTAGGGGQNVPMYKFPINITLNPYENFTLTFNFDNSPPLNATADIVLVLHSYMRRPT